MMSTRQGTTCVYNWLPNELLHETVSYLTDPRDLASLCLVSKLFRTLATEQLYSSVHLSDDFAPDTEGKNTLVFEHFQQTISTNPALARMVKNIKVDAITAKRSQLLKILPCLTKLSELRIHVKTFQNEWKEADAAALLMPNLAAISIFLIDGQELDSFLPSFLTRNANNIVSLTLTCILLEPDKNPFPNVCLPQLKYFKGELAYFLAVLENSPLLCYIELFFCARMLSESIGYIEAAWKKIRGSPAIKNGNLNIIKCTDCLDVFGKFPQIYGFLPNVKMFCVRHGLDVKEDGDFMTDASRTSRPERRDGIARALSRMPTISWIQLEFLPDPDSPSDKWQPTKEKCDEWFVQWFKACPNLRLCSLGEYELLRTSAKLEPD